MIHALEDMHELQPTCCYVPAGNWCMEAVGGGSLEVWVVKLSGHRLAVALINRSPMAASVRAPWDILGLAKGSKMSVRDVWSGEDDGVHSGQDSAEGSGKSAKLLVLKPGTSG